MYSWTCAFYYIFCFISMKGSPHENQSKVLGYQKWVEILMLTLVSSQKSLPPNISAGSVHISKILSYIIINCSPHYLSFVFTPKKVSTVIKNLMLISAPEIMCFQYILKSVHFKKTVARFSFLSKLWYILIQIKTKSTTVLKEMRIAQLSS